LLRSREDSEGIVQDVFLRIWDKRASLNEELSFNAYIFKIAKNLIYTRTSRKVTEHAYLDYAHYFSSEMRHLTEEAVFFSDLNSINERFIQQLPAKRKQIFLLSRSEGLNNKEIARRLNISVSTVENQINKTLKSLRDYLCQYDINFPLLIVFCLFY
jgi:RNA polymerase sigma-70 factor (ECF subfamily)